MEVPLNILEAAARLRGLSINYEAGIYGQYYADPFSDYPHEDRVRAYRNDLRAVSEFLLETIPTIPYVG